MIQKKVCMVGVFGTGKTSLVQQFVHSMFSERYLSTVGVKIDRKPLELDGTALTLVLWDLAGRDKHEDITSSYLRGAHAVLYVADGTRKETCDQLPELRALARTRSAGDAASAPQTLVSAPRVGEVALVEAYTWDVSRGLAGQRAQFGELVASLLPRAVRHVEHGMGAAKIAARDVLVLVASRQVPEHQRQLGSVQLQ